MKIVVIGASGRIGSRVVGELRGRGHDVIAASPDTGVNTVTGEGVMDALQGADAVVDVSNSPSLDGEAALAFFTASTTNLLEAEAAVGVRHHVALSVVGTDRLSDGGYFRAKLAQENLIAKASIPYSIVHATQFFEFVRPIADSSSDGSTVRVPPVLIQPIAADDVAHALARVAVGPPAHGIVEVAGPEQFRMDDLVRQHLAELGDRREVVTDPNAGYFGVPLMNDTLLPGSDAQLGSVRFIDWARSSAAPPARAPSTAGPRGRATRPATARDGETTDRPSAPMP